MSPPPPPAPHHHPSHAAAGSVEKQRRQQQEGQQQQQQKSSSTSSSSNSYVEELKCAQRVRISVDLVLAAKRELGFLRTIESLPFLHGGPAIYRAIRRYKLVNLLALVALPSLLDAASVAGSRRRFSQSFAGVFCCSCCCAFLQNLGAPGLEGFFHFLIFHDHMEDHYTVGLKAESLSACRYQEFWMPLAVTISADQGLQLQATRPSSSSSTASSSPSPSSSSSSSSSDVAAAARLPNGDHHAAAHGISSKCQQQQLDLLLLPPLDVQWVWHCHCLNPVSENHIHKITIVVHHHLIPLKMIHERLFYPSISA